MSTDEKHSWDVTSETTVWLSSYTFTYQHFKEPLMCAHHPKAHLGMKWRPLVRPFLQKDLWLWRFYIPEISESRCNCETFHNCSLVAVDVLFGACSAAVSVFLMGSPSVAVVHSQDCSHQANSQGGLGRSSVDASSETARCISEIVVTRTARCYGFNTVPTTCSANMCLGTDWEHCGVRIISFI